MKRKKIVLDLRLADPYTGIGVVTVKFLEFLQEEEYDISVLLLKGSDAAKQYQHLDHFYLNSVYGIADQIQLYGYLKRSQPDYVIFPHYFVGLFIPSGVRVISFVHDIMAVSHWKTFWDSFGRVKAFILKSYLKAALKNAELITPSYMVKNEIWRVFGFHARVVPNGRSDDHTGRMEKAKPGSKSGFLYIGNKRRHKNLDFLLRLFLKRKKDVLSIVSKDEIVATDNIKSYHKADRADLNRIAMGSKALLVPSYSEGFCIPIIDTITGGTKVFANRIPVFKDFYGLDISYFQTQDDSQLNFLMDNFDSLLYNRAFTSFFRSEDLFKWMELKFFISQL